MGEVTAHYIQTSLSRGKSLQQPLHAKRSPINSEYLPSSVVCSHNLGKQFGTRTGPTYRRPWSGSKMFDIWWFSWNVFYENVNFQKKTSDEKLFERRVFKIFFYYLLTMVGIGDWFSIRVFECVNQYAKFDPNIHVPFGSRVMSIFTNWPRAAGLMLRKASSIEKKMLRMPVVRQCWHAYVCKNLIQIYHAVQELWPFSLTANGRTDRRTRTVIIVHTCWLSNNF